MRFSSKNLIQIVILATVVCLGGCASIASAWDSTTTSIGDFFKSDKAEKPDSAEKPSEAKK